MSLAKSKAARKAALARPKTKAAAAAIAGFAATAALAGSVAATPVEQKPHQRPAPDGFGPMQANRFDEATAMANAAAGLKSYSVVAPNCASEAISYNLRGRRSVEHAPAHAVPTNGERKRFDLKTIGQETRNINAQAATDAALSHSANDVAQARKEKERSAYQAHHQMGDHLDDENGWDDARDFGKGKRR